MAVTVETFPTAVRVDEGGGLKVANSRVSLDSVVYAFNRGEDAAEIQRNFDTLTLAEVHAAISYYLHYKAKVDKYLEEQDALFERLRAEHEAMFPNRLTREMLLARKNGEDPNWPR
jgi:uncharacterized protein (DUF433 family)